MKKITGLFHRKNQTEPTSTIITVKVVESSFRIVDTLYKQRMAHARPFGEVIEITNDSADKFSSYINKFEFDNPDMELNVRTEAKGVFTKPLQTIRRTDYHQIPVVSFLLETKSNKCITFVLHDKYKVINTYGVPRVEESDEMHFVRLQFNEELPHYPEIVLVKHELTLHQYCNGKFAKETRRELLNPIPLINNIPLSSIIEAFSKDHILTDDIIRFQQYFAQNRIPHSDTNIHVLEDDNITDLKR